jgi:hypothetical protein
MVIEGGTCSTRITTLSSSCVQAGKDVPAGTVAVVRSPLALRCSTEQNALHTLIHQRHPTPSCGGHAPTAERTLNPARMINESLTRDPELENSQGHSRPIQTPALICWPMSPSHQQRTVGSTGMDGRFERTVPRAATRYDTHAASISHSSNLFRSRYGSSLTSPRPNRAGTRSTRSIRSTAPSSQWRDRRESRSRGQRRRRIVRTQTSRFQTPPAPARSWRCQRKA